MKHVLLAGIGSAVLASSLALAQGQPESILPPGFEEPAPAPTPAPAPQPTPAPAPATTPGAGSTPVVQELPEGEGEDEDDEDSSPRARALTLEQLESLDVDELDALLGLRPTFDIPPAERRSTDRVGIIDPSEGGFVTEALVRQPASLVRASIAGTRGRLVSRWGHIALRRALASRLAPPSGMTGVEFAGLRAGLLNRMGEFSAARAMAQDVDVDAWNPLLANAALDAYIATGDILGSCPLVRLRPEFRDDPEYRMLGSICAAYVGETGRARNELAVLLDSEELGDTLPVDILLAQRFAGAAGRGNSTVDVDWDGVDSLSPWRYSLATALGMEIPSGIADDAGPYYQRAAAGFPALSFSARLAGAARAAREGIFSSAAFIDLYSQIFASTGTEGEAGRDANQLRVAYIDPDPQERLSAIRALWGEDNAIDYERQVLTAYAAARIPAEERFAGEAAPLIVSMLAAGLDRDAARWSAISGEGGTAWGLLALANPDFSGEVGRDALEDYRDNDPSEELRRTQMLVAGLAGLGRISDGTRNALDNSLNLGLTRETKWSRLIARAGELRNGALVALLMGVGMQGDDWSRMTPRHLYHIVSALNAAGLNAEARMIAAEALGRV